MTSISRLGQIVIRRKVLKDSTHYLERDELWGLRRLPNKSAYVFVNERSALFGRMGIARIIERAGAEAGIGFPVHVLKHYLGHASITNTVRYSGMSPKPFREPWRGRR